MGESMNRPDATRPLAKTDDQRSPGLLEEAFSRYQDELLGTLYYLVGNREDARDALQEAFVRCWRHRQSVVEIVNLKAWIFRIALNVGRDLRSTAWRRRRRPLPEDESTLSSHNSQPVAEVLRRERLALVRQTLLKLRPEEQEVFLLRQNGDMTYEEIARSINIPLGTVKTRMRLALGKLREALEAKTSRKRDDD
jgi:RNA polymerase sigma factor (sigma-70 family)